MLSDMDSAPALGTYGLEVGYKGKALMAMPDLTLWPGKVVALIGQNGVGKSTLLRTITREQKAIAGSVYIQNENIDLLSRRQLACKVSVVTTDRDIAQGLLAREIVAMGRHPHTDLMGRLGEEDKRIVRNTMESTGILHKADSRFGELSDGERQKVMIARALAQQTPVMVLDEPFSFLDTAARIDILNLLKQLARENDTAVLFSSHDVAQALRMADDIWLITPDRKFFSGTSAELMAEGKVQQLFSSPNVRFDSVQTDFVAKQQP